MPVVTKGRGEAENSSVDMNYFFGIDSTGVLARLGRGMLPLTNWLPADHLQCHRGRAELPAKAATVLQTNVWYHAAVTFDGRYWKVFT